MNISTMRSRRCRLAAAGGLMLAALLPNNRASAGPAACTSTYTLSGPSYNATFIMVNGMASLLNAQGNSGSYDCIVQQDKLYSAFGPSGQAGVMQLTFSTINGIDTHSIQFSGFTAAPYTFSYNISVVASPPGPPLYLVGASSDLIQSFGTATLTESLTTNTITTINQNYSIDFTKTATASGQTITGAAAIVFADLTVWADVVDVLTVGPGGSNVASIENAFYQTPQDHIPEPASSMLLAAGLAALGLASSRRWRRSPLRAF